MRIEKITSEDVSMLDLLTSKLEENLAIYGTDFFRNKVTHAHISSLYDEESEERLGSRNRPAFSDWSNDPPQLGAVKRVQIQFDSKADFYDRYDMSSCSIPDNGQYLSSFLQIEWDYITGVFYIYIGTHEYEKDTSSVNIKKVYRSEQKNSHVFLNFDSQYRSDIQRIKIRLGKLYFSLFKNNDDKREAFARKSFTDAAVSAFPDILDPLILGGSLSEERNDRAVSSKRRNDSKSVAAKLP